MEKIILGIVMGMAVLYFLAPYLGLTGKGSEYPIVSPNLVGNIKLDADVKTYWKLLNCEADIDYVVTSHGNVEARNVKLHAIVENPALDKIRDTEDIKVGNILPDSEAKLGNFKLSYPCDDDIVKITMTVSDDLGRTDEKIYEERKS